MLAYRLLPSLHVGSYSHAGHERIVNVGLLYQCEHTDARSSCGSVDTHIKILDEIPQRCERQHRCIELKQELPLLRRLVERVPDVALPFALRLDLDDLLSGLPGIRMIVSHCCPRKFEQSTVTVCHPMSINSSRLYERLVLMDAPVRTTYAGKRTSPAVSTTAKFARVVKHPNSARGDDAVENEALSYLASICTKVAYGGDVYGVLLVDTGSTGFGPD